MDYRDLPDRRLDRRVPLGCAAALFSPGGVRWDARCVELSVGGMTLVTAYVPGESEVVEVEVQPPVERPTAAPLRVKARVKRCHGHGDGHYELGLETLRVIA
ncbi:MAG: PilZ domain-containing protein [Zoogloeaceae bacterium]|nr:PilZ domain-containing protein [Zoogloeaceae bacterium]